MDPAPTTYPKQAALGSPARLVTQRSDVLARYAEAMLAAQRFEQAMVGLLGVCGELEAGDDLDALTRAQDAWGRLYEFTAGRLRIQLEGGQRLADPELVADVERAVEARNVLAHHYLRDRESRLEEVEVAAQMVERLTDTMQRFDALTTRLDTERLAAMRVHGLTDDHVTTPDERSLSSRMRHFGGEFSERRPPCRRAC